jgi:hypothetical protein
MSEARNLNYDYLYTSAILRGVYFIASLSSAAVSMNAGFLRGKLGVFGDTIKGTPPIIPHLPYKTFLRLLVVN